MGIKNIPEYARTSKADIVANKSLEVWEPPPSDMIKLNFDGAVKGNPGPAGLGGVSRNIARNILGMYWGFIGENTNNMAKLKALLAGLNMAMTHGWFPIITEGDSQIILQTTTKLLHGKPVNRVVDNWCMAYNLE